MSTTSTEDFERSCDQVFNKLQELAQELKSHDHEEIHFNIEHAAQYVEHNKIGVKFKEQVRLLNGDVSYELICAINDCNTHLNDCMSICKRMGTPSWSTEQDSRLTMSWTFVYASLSKAGLILKLKPLEAQAFLAFNRQQPSFEPPTISRRESFMSNAGSENFTIEGRAERRERAERQRQGQRREPMLVTPTGTRLRTQPNRTSASVRSVAASTSSASSSTASLRLPTRPAVPEREKWVINPSIISTPRTPPPEYTPIPKDTRPVIPPDEKPPSPSTNAIYAFTSAINEVCPNRCFGTSTCSSRSSKPPYSLHWERVPHIPRSPKHTTASGLAYSSASPATTSTANLASAFPTASSTTISTATSRSV
ncbi:hypothetical protein NW765_006409 [Fusarium oxysporum]|nr:hypothetical protein NW765_006409 [Fusarium oxysporum]